MADNLAMSEQVTALAEELAAITRCGMPLDEGLAAVASDTNGEMGRSLQSLSDALGAGTPLPDALREQPQLPPLFRAVVEAGLRSNNLAAALEKLAAASNSLRELNQQLRFAMIYPALVVALAYALFVLSALYLLPILQEASESITRRPSSDVSAALQTFVAQWGWAPPLIGLVAAGWFVSRDTPPWWSRSLRRLALAKRHAIFAELLSLLVDQSVPLDQAIVLAAGAAGHAPTAREAQRLAKELQAGLNPRQTGALEKRRLPPMLATTLQTTSSPEQLSRALSRAAKSYRRQAEELQQWCELYLPMFMTILVGGAATFAYAVLMVLPWSRLLRDMAYLLPQ